MAATITSNDIMAMVKHWLDTPVNGYLGSGYGNDLKSLLQSPLSAGVADSFLAKLRNDVPPLQLLPPNAINLYGRQSAPDRLDIFIEISGKAIQVT
ncbi:conserved hypothetical protein [Gammaproteobacteria bacterium]